MWADLSSWSTSSILDVDSAIQQSSTFLKKSVSELHNLYKLIIIADAKNSLSSKASQMSRDHSTTFSSMSMSDEKFEWNKTGSGPDNRHGVLSTRHGRQRITCLERIFGWSVCGWTNWMDKVSAFGSWCFISAFKRSTIQLSNDIPENGQTHNQTSLGCVHLFIFALSVMQCVNERRST